MSKPTAKPWEPQEIDGKKEGTKAYQAFSLYLLQEEGERSAAKVAEELGKSENLIYRWCSQWNWVERAALYDAEQLRRRRVQQEKEIANMRKRHATLATNMLAKAAKALQTKAPEELTPQDIKAFVDVASKLERISRGDSGEVVEERDGGQAINPVQIYIPDNNRDGGEEDDGE